jgi:hypothetical protein
MAVIKFRHLIVVSIDANEMNIDIAVNVNILAPVGNARALRINSP